MTIIKQRDISKKYLYIQSTAQCMSPRRNWGSPNPSPASECAPPPQPKGKGGAQSPAGGGWGSPNSDDWRKSLALCLLCGYKQAGKDKKKAEQPMNVNKHSQRLWGDLPMFLSAIRSSKPAISTMA